MVCVRENTEGEYAGVGGRVHVGMGHEVGIQVDVFTRHGVERIVRYALRAGPHRGAARLASITKSNASPHHFVMWDEIVDAGRTPTSPTSSSTAAGRRRLRLHGQPAAAVRRAWSRPTCSATSSPTSARPSRAAWAWPPSANIAPDGAGPGPVRAGARLGPGHRRQGHRQPDRRGLGRGDDARPPRRDGRGRRGDGRRRVGASAATARARPTWAAAPRRAEVGDELVRAVAPAGRLVAAVDLGGCPVEAVGLSRRRRTWRRSPPSRPPSASPWRSPSARPARAHPQGRAATAPTPRRAPPRRPGAGGSRTASTSAAVPFVHAAYAIFTAEAPPPAPRRPALERRPVEHRRHLSRRRAGQVEPGRARLLRRRADDAAVDERRAAALTTSRSPAPSAATRRSRRRRCR